MENDQIAHPKNIICRNPARPTRVTLSKTSCGCGPMCLTKTPSGPVSIQTNMRMSN